MSSPRNRIWSLISPRRRKYPSRLGDGRGSADERPVAGVEALRQMKDRGAAAAIVVQRGLLQAEEMYLVEPSASLGTWFARVQETIAVASRVTLRRIDESRRPSEGDIADEQLGLHADICAEAIRAAAQVWGGGPSPHARGEILDLLSGRRAPSRHLSWTTLLVSLAHCSAALEPLANGLREADLPMGEPTDCEVVAECLLEAAGHAFGAVYALC